MENKNFLLSLIIILLLGIPVLFFLANDKKETVSNWKPVDNNIAEVQPSVPEKQPEKPQYSENPTTYEEAVSKAKATDKKLFLFFTADYCGYCKAMKRDTLSDENVKKELDKYVFYMVDTQKESTVAKKYNIGAIPAYLIENTSSGKVEKSGIGYKTANGFLRWIEGEAWRQRL